MEWNDLVRDLALSKGLSEVLASRLNEKKLASDQVPKIRSIATGNKNSFNISLKRMIWFIATTSKTYFVKWEYLPTIHKSGTFFLDRSKVSLKCVLLHNRNSYASIIIGHSTTLKEQYQSIKIVSEKLANEEHQWHMISKWQTFYLPNKVFTQSFHASSVFGIAGLEKSIG